MYLPAEFDSQGMVQLTWPHRATDWISLYDDVINCYCRMASEISKHESLLIVAQNIEDVKKHLSSHNINEKNIQYFQCPVNDTWARDHAFITCIHEKQRILMDFQFNGWGLKFAANYDNQINQRLFDAGIIEGVYTDCRDFVLEGGSIESDGKGTLMTTSSCLLADNRNGGDKKNIEKQLCQFFNARRVLWIDHSWLAGDDTDGHIDTVARFCNEETIAYVKCYDKTDEHYNEMEALENELKMFRTIDGNPYKLIPLPLPEAICDNNERLPATYANFLILNDAVLVPTYRQKNNDEEAISQLSKVFADREIIGIDCRVLIKQHGSLHCSTMQYPKV